jgi:hypothetical protein
MLGMNVGDPNEFVGYSDSDWCHNIDCHQTILGYVFMLGDSVISWSSKQQLTIQISTITALCITFSSPFIVFLSFTHLSFAKSLVGLRAFESSGSQEHPSTLLRSKQ